MIINEVEIDIFPASNGRIMKQPLAPKPFHELFAENREKFLAVLEQRLGPTVEGRYEHWDKLRRREPPEGLTHEQWWLGVKFARNSQYRQLPMRDTRSQPFVYMLPDHVQQALHQIDSQARSWASFAEHVTNTETRDRFIVNSLIEEAITSSQLEGASTTRIVATNMIRAGRRPKDRSERMILNNYRAMEDIRDLQKNPLTIESLLQLHATLTVATLDDSESEGRIQRPDDERVRVWDERDQRVVHTPPPASELPDRMQEMIRFANGGSTDQMFLHPVIRAIALHFWLAYDHPFQDGNGRTARSLFYWSMLRHDYWMFEFTSISRYLRKAPAQYGRAFLHTENDGNDLTYFIVHQIDTLLRALSDVESYIKAKIEQTREVEEMLRRSSNLNHRQVALLAHAIRHSDAEYTIRSHQTSHRVVYATARADLFRLADLKLLERQRIGQKTFVFRVPPDLEHRIRSIGASD